MISADGRWIAYNSRPLGQDPANGGIYVRRYRPSALASGGQWQIADPEAVSR
jgi:hypothetical protein